MCNRIIKGFKNERVTIHDVRIEQIASGRYFSTEMTVNVGDRGRDYGRLDVKCWHGITDELEVQIRTTGTTLTAEETAVVARGYAELARMGAEIQARAELIQSEREKQDKVRRERRDAERARIQAEEERTQAALDLTDPANGEWSTIDEALGYARSSSTDECILIKVHDQSMDADRSSPRYFLIQKDHLGKVGVREQEVSWGGALRDSKHYAVVSQASLKSIWAESSKAGSITLIYTRDQWHESQDDRIEAETKRRTRGVAA